MIMLCKQCKYMDRCAVEADYLGQVFDPNYDGEHGCVEFEAFTNADRIRAMSDEVLASQLVQVFKEGIKVLTDMDMPEELLDKIWHSFLERLKQPAEGDVNNG